MLATTLFGCTASWRAPVESRGSNPPATRTSPARSPSANTISPAISGGEYRVKRGDTLHGIAWQSGIDYRTIASWNGLRPPYHIYAGQTLQLRPPPSRRSPPPEKQPVAKARPASPSQPPSNTAATRQPSAAASGGDADGSRQLSWTWPADGQVVSAFKHSDPLRSGIKIAGQQGRKIRSAESGKVVYSGSGLIGYGRLIIVKHNDNYLSAYGHNRKILVAEGDQVTKGQTIAEMGAANDGQAQLHFEIRRDGKPVDPLKLLPRR